MTADRAIDISDSGIEVEQEDKEPTCYNALVRCENCGDERYHEIPKGQSVYNHMWESRCRKCGMLLIQSERKSKRE